MSLRKLYVPLHSTPLHFRHHIITVYLLIFLGDKSFLRCCFVPDCSANLLKGYIVNILQMIGRDSFLIDLNYLGTKSLNWSILSLPNIHELNDKRYEIRCLNYIRDLRLGEYDIIVADASSCEAILRYCETESLHTASTTKLLVLMDSPDIYTAGERHGRQFRGSLISKNCPTIGFIATTHKSLAEANNLVGQIYPSVSVGVSQVLADESDMQDALLKALTNVIEKNIDMSVV